MDDEVSQQDFLGLKKKRGVFLESPGSLGWPNQSPKICSNNPLSVHW